MKKIKKIKIGIITFHKSINYGAMLQSFALFSYLKKQGFDVYVIDYNRNKGKNSFFSKHTLRTAFSMVMSNPFSIISILKKIKNKNKNKKTPTSQIVLNKKRKLEFLFDEFRNNHLQFTKLRYESPIDLKKNPPKMDIYVAGSDQIWGYGDTTFSDAYFLNFGGNNIRKISYAPSFGASNIPKSKYNDLRRVIKIFDAVSIREKAGVKIIKEACNIDATHVLDPTLLLDDYSMITSYEKQEPFVFVYRLKQDEALKNKLQSLTNKISGALNVGIKTVAPMDETNIEENDQIVGVEDFLGLLSNSKFVITNSFHGTVFAIINRVDFICCARTHGEGGQNDRMVSLLSDLKLMDRYYNLDDSFDLDKILADKIDWKTVSDQLEKLRKISYNFLQKSLN